MGERPKLVIVDDEREMAEFVGEVAEAMGFEPILAFSAKECLDVVAKQPPAAIIMDVVMPSMDGVELVRELSKIVSGLPFIVMSGYQPIYTDMVNTLASSSGLVNIGRLTKPFTAAQIEELLAPILESVE